MEMFKLHNIEQISVSTSMMYSFGITFSLFWHLIFDFNNDDDFITPLECNALFAFILLIISAILRGINKWIIGKAVDEEILEILYYIILAITALRLYEFVDITL